MALTKNNENSIVLDACVLAPMPLCDTLLRLAERPAFFRPLWSEYLLHEVGKVLTKMGYSAMQRERRLNAMTTAFPETTVQISADFIETIDCPDPNDRHVLAAAIQGRANAIVTNNVRDFPERCRAKYGILCQTPDEFLIQYFHLKPALLLARLDQQCAAIRLSRNDLIVKLQKLTPLFTDLLREY